MSDKFKDLGKKALESALRKKSLTEGRIIYDENHTERIHPDLVNQLRNRNHSLGKHPIFPDSDEMHFEEKLVSKRFSDIIKTYKKNFEVDEIALRDVGNNMMKTLGDTIRIEVSHKRELEELAVKLIREEYDMPEESVEIIAELTTDIKLDGVKKNPTPIEVTDVEFDNHDSIKTANDEVYKRRFVNAMIQGAAKKSNHMFHMIDNELMDIDPQLLNNYSKLMSAADYAYMIVNDDEPKQAGGLVKVTLPKKEGDKPVIHAKAMTLPVLIHELVKGVMEIISAHGLPKDKKLTKYVLGKADFMEAEMWDMRLGPSLWENFTEMIEPEDFHLKHHIFCDLVALPVNEFNHSMREIMAGTKEGKNIVNDVVKNIKEDIKQDDYESAMGTASDDDTMGPDELNNIDWDWLK